MMTTPKTQPGDVILMEFFNGRMVRTSAEPRLPNNANFLIVNRYGDHSPFMTWSDVQQRVTELSTAGKPDGYYAVVER
jgi:hypothetical protein